MLLGECRAFIYLKVCLHPLAEVGVLSGRVSLQSILPPSANIWTLCKCTIVKLGNAEAVPDSRPRVTTIIRFMNCAPQCLYCRLIPSSSWLSWAKTAECLPWLNADCRAEYTSLIFWLLPCDWAQRDGGYVFPECVGGSCLELQTHNLLLQACGWKHRFHI